MIASHAAQTYPEECCGLLLGVWDSASERRRLRLVVPVDNTWSTEVEALEGLSDDDGAQTAAEFSLDRRRRYWIAPRTMLKVQREARDRGLNIIGVYHSHPDYPAVPSERDRQLAWSDYSYLIVSVQAGQSVDLKSWYLQDDTQQFVEEAIATES
ncbi:MAG: M67 family metallopeptidase [Cyanobacteria bacterium P01_H01_bin.119]